MPDAVDAALQPQVENGCGATPLMPARPDVFDDSELLLEFAASNGRLPAAEASNGAGEFNLVRDLLIASKAARDGRLSCDILGRFWIAYARLSSLTRPVTAASIRASDNHMILMKFSAIVLVFLVISFSMLLFMVNSTTSDINDLVEQQNSAALKLWSDLQMLTTNGADQAQPAEAADIASTAQRDTTIKEHVFEEMVEFSRKSNWLLESASRLNFWFAFPGTHLDIKEVTFNRENPDKITGLLISPELSLASDLRQEGIKQIKAYQLIRNYALALYKTNTLIYGSITTYLLPTIYALLGAFLYGFRLYSRLIRRREYLGSAAHSARYFIAAIAGLVVGLFGSLFPKSVSLPPLAIAFLVGYAVEAFFSRLDDVIIKLKGSEPPAQVRNAADAGAD